MSYIPHTEHAAPSGECNYYVCNIQQISYIPQTEQHSRFGLMPLRLGNVTCVCVCVYVRVCVCVCVDTCMCDPTLSGLVCLVIQCSVLMVSEY